MLSFFHIEWWRRFWPWLFILFCLIGVFALFKDYGITWDEPVGFAYGQKVLDYFSSGFTDKRCNEIENLKYYGPFFEMLSAIASRPFKGALYEIHHLCIALCALSVLPAVIKLGKLIGGEVVALLSVVALIAMPQFIGHSFNNTKDIPFAVFFSWAMLNIAALLNESKFAWSRIYATAGTIGLVLAVRIGGLLLFFYLGVFVLVWLAQRRPANLKQGFQMLEIPKFCALFILAWSIMVIAWPWAHENPLLNPLRAFQKTVSFDLSIPVLFEGKIIQSDNLPSLYLIKYLLLLTPPAFLVFTAIGITRMIIEQKKSPRSRKTLLFFIIQFWLIFPLIYFAVMRPNAYDGIRHFLFVLPALALCVGFGAAYVYSFLKQKSCGSFSFALVLALMLSHVPALVVLHPYEMTYFNFLAGPRSQLSKRYDLDYWSSSYKEAAEWINLQQSRTRKPLKVLIAGTRFSQVCATYYFDQRITSDYIFNFKHAPVGELPPGVDYYIAALRYGQDRNFMRAPIVHQIERSGAVLSVIKSR
jgi:hypothetical protein